jgi:hypothetical protein
MLKMNKSTLKNELRNKINGLLHPIPTSNISSKLTTPKNNFEIKPNTFYEISSNELMKSSYYAQIKNNQILNCNYNSSSPKLQKLKIQKSEKDSFLFAKQERKTENNFPKFRSKNLKIYDINSATNINENNKLIEGKYKSLKNILPKPLYFKLVNKMDGITNNINELINNDYNSYTGNNLSNKNQDINNNFLNKIKNVKIREELNKQKEIKIVS